MIKYALIFFPFFLFSQGSLIVEEGFESSSSWTGGANTFNNAVDNDNAALAGNAREGSFCISFSGAAGAERSEVVITDSDNYFAWGTEYWVGYSMKVVSKVNGFEIVSQHHAIPNDFDYSNTAGPNSFSITTATPTELTIRTATEPEKVFDTTPTGGALGGSVSTPVAYTQGVWIDVVSHFLLATDNTGYYEVWINGVKVVDVQDGPTTYYYDSDGDPKEPFDYQKLGCYYGSGNASGEMHYDCYRIWEGAGGTYQDVSPLGLGPEGQAPPTPDDPDRRRDILQQTTMLIQG